LKSGATTNKLNSIFFLNPSQGFYVANTANSLYKTTNGGLSWSRVPHTNADSVKIKTSQFFNIEFFKDSIGVAVGICLDAGVNKGIIVRSGDYGQTWSIRYLSNVTGLPQINDLSVTDSVLFACGPNGNFLKSTNNGLTWVRTVINSGYNLNRIAFRNSLMGCANYGTNSIRTTNGGSSWVSATGLNGAANEITIEQTGRGYYAGNASLYRTSDAWGWTKLGSDGIFSSNSPLDVKIISLDSVIINTSNQVWISGDQGLTWNAADFLFISKFLFSEYQSRFHYGIFGRIQRKL
jgi:photosystem II stability/assembly factor-like uncharacterized protein